jgi:hypothetical protein
MRSLVPATHVAARTSFVRAISKAKKATLFLFPLPCCWRAAQRRCAGNPRSTVSIRTRTASLIHDRSNQSHFAP